VPNTDDAPWIFLGLGNPGDEHAGDRHNIGAQCVTLFARKHKLKLDTTWRAVRVGQGQVEGTPVVLARPRTYMNESGLAAETLLQRLKAPPERLVALCDDLDLPAGKLRLRAAGSTAGHRGLASIEREIGTREFPRIRIGIGRPYPQTERQTRSKDDYEEGIIRWVLGNFTKAEEELMTLARERVVEAMRCILSDGITPAMNRFN